eukprot:g74918.t1
MRRLGLYLSVAFKAPVLVTMCMSVENRNPIRFGMLVLVEKRYGGKSLLDMIIRWQKYIVASPKGDIGYWLDENRLSELQIQRDYGGKIPTEFFTAHLLHKLSKIPYTYAFHPTRESTFASCIQLTTTKCSHRTHSFHYPTTQQPDSY